MNELRVIKTYLFNLDGGEDAVKWFWLQGAANSVGYRLTPPSVFNIQKFQVGGMIKDVALHVWGKRI